MDEVSTRVEDLIQALRAHATAMVLNRPDGSAMPEINAVREAAHAYVTAVSRLTGWGNVFGDLEAEFGLLPVPEG